MIERAFGGDWTENKLRRLRDYLVAYRSIFTANPSARHFKTWYVDAFAGTGSRTSPISTKSTEEEGTPDTEADKFFEGSARIALSIPSPFDRYLFVEGVKKRTAALQTMVAGEFSQLAPRIDIKTDDANVALTQWCGSRDWSAERAVVFLDPYGMQVSWNTVQMLGDTKGVDLWYLFSLAGVIRMLTRDGVIDESWQKRLDAVFGTADWKGHFYRTEMTADLFGLYEVTRRDATAQNVVSYIEGRLKSAYVAVAPSLVLRNSKSFPLFAFCFAASNPKGASTALKIATHLLKEE